MNWCSGNSRRLGETKRDELGTLAISDCNDFTDIADDADYIQLPRSVNMVSAIRVPQVHKNARIYPSVRKLPAGFSLRKRRNLVP